MFKCYFKSLLDFVVPGGVNISTTAYKIRIGVAIASAVTTAFTVSAGSMVAIPLIFTHLLISAWAVH